MLSCPLSRLSLQYPQQDYIWTPQFLITERNRVKNTYYSGTLNVPADASRFAARNRREILWHTTKAQLPHKIGLAPQLSIPFLGQKSIREGLTLPLNSAKCISDDEENCSTVM